MQCVFKFGCFLRMERRRPVGRLHEVVALLGHGLQARVQGTRRGLGLGELAAEVVGLRRLRLQFAKQVLFIGLQTQQRRLARLRRRGQGLELRGLGLFAHRVRDRLREGAFQLMDPSPQLLVRRGQREHARVRVHE